MFPETEAVAIAAAMALATDPAVLRSDHCTADNHDKETHMSDTKNQVLKALDTYKSAVLAKNAETFMHLYAPDVRVFDMWGRWSYEGAAAWRIAVEGWFSSLGDEKVRVTFDDVKIIEAQGFAALSAIVTYAAASAQGQELRAMQNRISWVLKSSGHVLRVVHEHSSAPIGFEDSKAMLKREGRP